MIGLLRLLLVLVGFFLLRRVIASAMKPRSREPKAGQVRDGERKGQRSVEDLSAGQSIEEADYEELD